MEPFEIPAYSFTAFRLAYLRSQEVSESSKCLLLGALPHLWIHDEGKGLLKESVRNAKSSMKKSLDESVNRLGVDYRSIHNRVGGNSKFDTIIEGLQQQYLDSASEDNEVLLDDFGEDNEVLLDEFGEDDEVLLDEFGDDDRSGSKPSNNLDTSFYSDTTIDQHFHRLSISPYNQSRSDIIVNSNNSNVTDNSKNNATISTKIADKVAFAPSTKRKNRIDIAHPEPTTEISEELIAAEKRRHRLRKKLKTFAKHSKGRAKRTTNDIRYKIHNTIIRKFKTGEIILRERALVLTKETVNVKSFSKFEENEPCDTRIYERWKEYLVVLRKTGIDAVSIQLYKVEEKKRKKKNTSNKEESDGSVKPEYDYELKGIKANLYSLVDKSISLAIPNNNWCIIHILKFRQQVKNMKWLYFIKQVLGDPMTSDIDISIPDLDLKVSLNIPEEVFFESLKPINTVRLQPLEKDYKFHHSPLLEYLLESVQRKLSQHKDERVANWLAKLDKPWFCFKSYDRLEWVTDDSEIFFIQNQVLTGGFQLELRNLMRDKKHVEILGCQLTDPVPIEGFLARLTNIKGNDHTILRTFYKILYFNTSDNLLFFTKFYRGLPPKATGEISDVYEHCSFMLDENDQIPWLNSKDFESMNHIALEEFERKAQLLLKADSVIDLTSVISIESVPLKKIKLAHKILLSVLWYGNTTSIIDDQFILDSCFEITTVNQGKIRLQAPNRKVRDEWIKRLLEIREYWITKKQLEVERINETRGFNMKALHIPEYVDSNISQESTLTELKHYKADPFVNTIDGIALTNNLMMSGYLFEKPKKHSNFNQFFAVLSSGSLILYSLYNRSKLTGEWSRASYFQHYLTIPLMDCYVYSGYLTSIDLLNRNRSLDPTNPGHKALSRIYVDGWKSSDEEPMRCFTLWFGTKRSISHNAKPIHEPKNPNIVKMIRLLGVTGQSIVFMARSRQERELWVSRIYTEIDRYLKLYNL